MNRSSDRGAGIGFASVLMIIMVLAFTCFGVLALVSARADMEFTDRTAEYVKEYYDAKTRMARRLNDLDELIDNGERSFSQDGTIELEESINETLSLVVVVKQSALNQNARYEQISSSVISKDEGIEIVESPNVWKGPAK